MFIENANHIGLLTEELMVKLDDDSDVNIARRKKRRSGSLNRKLFVFIHLLLILFLLYTAATHLTRGESNSEKNGQRYSVAALLVMLLVLPDDPYLSVF